MRCRLLLVLSRLVLMLSAALPAPLPAWASLLRTTGDSAGLCGPAIVSAERAHGSPPGLLQAIALVESGRPDPVGGGLAPWPWTIDVEGAGHVYQTEDQAIAAVVSFRAAGHTSIDVGCMQVNLQQHPDAFATLQAAFDPWSNADYAASFLHRLRDAAGDWMIAAGQYHSLTPGLAAPYRAKVMAMLQQNAGTGMLAMAMPEPRGPMALSPFGGNRYLMQGGLVRAAAGVPPPQGSPAAGAGRSLAAYRASPIAILRRPRLG